MPTDRRIVQYGEQCRLGDDADADASLASLVGLDSTRIRPIAYQRSLSMDRTDNPPLWSHVQALAAIAQAGNFTLAAQRLGLSKAAVSQRVVELERAVGVPLVQRTTRSVRLTDAGQHLVDETLESFAQIERSLAAVRNLADQPRGLVRVTAPVALGRQQVAPHLDEFLRAWPDIRVDLSLDDRLVNLGQDGFDLAIRHVAAPPENHVAWRLCGSRTLLVASPEYLRERGEPTHPSELDGHACLAYLRSGPAVWRFERNAAGAAMAAHAGQEHAEGSASPDRSSRERTPLEPERASVNVQGPLRANNSELLRDAVLSGLGIAQVPDFSAAAALRAGRMVELLPGWRPIGFFGDAIYALRPWSPQVPMAVQALVTHLRGALANGFEPATAA
ncbi:MAG: LysR family transcriptional regulator [Rhizobacter sp.]|nr:LysR family transcriptional regulator [Rhizobacter sp.]